MYVFKMLMAFIFFIIINFIILLPIEEWKTRLNGKCSCFESLFGKYPPETQNYITQHLQLDESDNCIPISMDIDILDLQGVKESLINSINS